MPGRAIQHQAHQFICGTQLDLDFDQMRFAIRVVAMRNRLRHNGAGEMIKNCDFQQLGDQLVADIRDVPAVFGPDFRDKMTGVLHFIRDKYLYRLQAGNHQLSQTAAEMRVEKLGKEIRRVNTQAKQAAAEARQRAVVAGQAGTSTKRMHGRRVGGTHSLP
ncbi:MAG: hypothetical protein LQ350_004866 [Teloschistes chrysophthalmus]|nr:MAG: hypothetical protein LQ350_004866 [Niorma chrysophthalma]